MKTEPSLAITLIEVFVLFVLGIFGNQISDILQISRAGILIWTGVCLVVLFIVNLLKAGKIQSSELKRYLPVSMLGVFPAGILFGFCSAVLTFWIVRELGWSKISISLNELKIFSYKITFGWTLYSYELAGFFIIVLFGIISKIFIKPKLTFSIMIAYGVAYSALILFLTPHTHHPSTTIFGNLGFTLIAALLIYLFSPTWKSLTE